MKAAKACKKVDQTHERGPLSVKLGRFSLEWTKVAELLGSQLFGYSDCALPRLACRGKSAEPGYYSRN